MKRSRMVKELDKLWQQCVMLAWKNECCMCGLPATAGHHMIKRRFMFTRWAIMNGVALCTACHRKVEDTTEGKKSLDDILMQKHRYHWLFHLKYKPLAMRNVDGLNSDELIATREKLKTFIKNKS